MLPCTAALAALWLLLLKRLRYPVLYTYVRTGNEQALLAQGIYAAVLVATAFAILLAYLHGGRAILRHRKAIVAVGLAGGAGLALLALSDFSQPGQVLGACVGAALLAACLPSLAAFWGLGLLQHEPGATIRILVGSFAVFGLAYILLHATGLDSALVSIACPVLSGALALLAPEPPAEATGARKKPPAAREGGLAAPMSATPVSVGALAPSTARAALGDALASPAATPASVSASASSAASPAASQPGPGAFAPEDTGNPAPMPRKGGFGNLGMAGPAIPDDGLPALQERFAEEFELSKREAELAAYAYRNYSARRIASELFIAESTVYTHLKRIYRKTGVHSKQELIELIDAWKRQNA